jgi:hypothetical protein
MPWSKGSDLTRVESELSAQAAMPNHPAFDRELAAQRCPELLAYLGRLERAMSRSKLHTKTEDLKFLPQMVEGLNAKDPSLRLKLYQLDTTSLRGLKTLTQHLRKGMSGQEGWRDGWRAVLDLDGRHRVALSVRCTGNAASFIVVDAVPQHSTSAVRAEMWQQAMKRLEHHFSRRPVRSGEGAPLPFRFHTTLVFSGVQNTREGCCVFALSAVKKMAAEPTIAQMHSRKLEEIARTAGEEAGPAASAEQQREPDETVSLEGAASLPSSFLKHSTSASALRSYIAGRAGQDSAQAVAEERVNKKGQTLMERRAAHMVVRYAPPPASTWFDHFLECIAWPREMVPFEYSNSYEHKRLEFVRTAIAHIAPPAAEPASGEAGGTR